jgi:integrase/recombinase XerD
MARVQKKRKPETPPSTPLEMLVQGYQEHCAVKNHTEETLRVHGEDLKRFLNWCAERGLVEPLEITRPVLERYQRHLFHYRKKNGEPLSFASQRRCLCTVRMWCRWMTRSNYLLHNPASELDLPRVPHALPPVLSADEMELVLQQPNLADPMGVRDRAILETFYSTGVRRAELLSLKVYDVNRASGLVTIREGKGKKDRVVPIGERALLWMDKYLNEVRPHLVIEPDEGTIFLTGDGEPFSKNHLSCLTRMYVESANLGKSGACHIFRHTTATVMLENGADIRYIQEMLGHEKLDTTQIYTHVAVRLLKHVHAATHPAAQLKRDDHAGSNGQREKEQLKTALLTALVQESDEE